VCTLTLYIFFNSDARHATILLVDKYPANRILKYRNMYRVLSNVGKLVIECTQFSRTYVIYKNNGLNKNICNIKIYFLICVDTRRTLYLRNGAAFLLALSVKFSRSGPACTVQVVPYYYRSSPRACGV